MIRSTLIAEWKNFSPENVFRWLVIEDLFPEIRSKIHQFSHIDQVESYIRENISDNVLKEKCLSLLLDKENTKGGALEIQEIKDIIGL